MLARLEKQDPLTILYHGAIPVKALKACKIRNQANFRGEDFSRGIPFSGLFWEPRYFPGTVTPVTEQPTGVGYPGPMITPETNQQDIYRHYQRAHESLHELTTRRPLASDTAELAAAIREAISAEKRVIQLCSEALGWFRAA